jgi:hypothetical protein
MKEHCWICAWLELDVQDAPHLIGGRVYTHRLCPTCRHAEAEKIEQHNRLAEERRSASHAAA